MTLLLISLLTTTLALPQTTVRTTPDFSGTWLLDPAESASPPIKVTIRQGPTEIVIETTNGDLAPESSTYPIVAEATPTLGAIGAGVLRAYWAGAKLVNEKGGTVSGQTVSVRETRTLAPGGGEMTVEALVVVQHGYSLRGGQNYATSKNVFKRVTP